MVNSSLAIVDILFGEVDLCGIGSEFRASINDKESGAPKFTQNFLIDKLGDGIVSILYYCLGYRLFCYILEQSDSVLLSVHVVFQIYKGPTVLMAHVLKGFFNVLDMRSCNDPGSQVLF